MSTQISDAILSQSVPRNTESSPPMKRRKRTERPPLSYRSPLMGSMSYERPPTPVSPQQPSWYDLRPTRSASSRRSVVHMKTLMPLRLTSPSTSPQTSSMAKSPNHYFGDSFTPRQEHAELNARIPWMDSPQTAPRLGEVNPRKYRETPVYSEPNSPLLSRAYHNNSEAMNEFSIPCFVEEKTQNSEDLVMYTDCSESISEDDGSDSDDEASVSTAPTSQPSERSVPSGLFFKCIGLNSEDSWRAASPTPAADVEEFSTSRLISRRFSGASWMEDDSSRCSSPDSIVEFAEARYTPLAPAKPQVVRVLGTDSPLQSRFPPRSSSLTSIQAEPISPRAWVSRCTAELQQTIKSPEAPTHPETILFKRKSRPAPLDLSHTICFRDKSACVAPPLSPLGSPFEEGVNYTRSAPRYKFDVQDIAEEVLAFPHVESICDTIDGSPRDLQIDSYCISQIRRRNRAIRISSLKPLSPPLFSSRELSYNQVLKRPSRTKSIFGNFRPARPTLAQSRDSIAIASLPPRARRTLQAASQMSEPDLGPFRNIFPDTDDWWRSVLYAHVLAYNYISALKDRECAAETSSPRSSSLMVPSKATRTLGISASVTMPNIRSVKVSQSSEIITKHVGIMSTSFGRILTALASCITRIIGCMTVADDVDAARLRIQDGIKEEIDWTVVRSLGEIVRCAELGPPTTGGRSSRQ